MSQVVLEQVSLAYGNSVMLDKVQLVIESGEKLPLID